MHTHTHVFGDNGHVRGRILYWQHELHLLAKHVLATEKGGLGVVDQKDGAHIVVVGEVSVHLVSGMCCAHTQRHLNVPERNR